MLSGVDCLLIRETFFSLLSSSNLEDISPRGYCGHSFIYVFKIGCYCRAIGSFFSASYLSTELSTTSRRAILMRWAFCNVIPRKFHAHTRSNISKIS